MSYATVVGKLYMNYNQIDGRLPPSISALTLLEEFFAFGNKLEGQIPASIGLLTRLRVLSLAENSFSGSLPPELNDLTNLELLSIQREGGTDVSNVGTNQRTNADSGVGITGPLPSLNNLKYLQALYLGTNRISGESEEVCLKLQQQVLFSKHSAFFILI